MQVFKHQELQLCHDYINAITRFKTWSQNIFFSFFPSIKICNSQVTFSHSELKRDYFRTGLQMDTEVIQQVKSSAYAPNGKRGFVCKFNITVYEI